jgi:hypothetical protein
MWEVNGSIIARIRLNKYIIEGYDVIGQHTWLWRETGQTALQGQLEGTRGLVKMW